MGHQPIALIFDGLLLEKHVHQPSLALLLGFLRTNHCQFSVFICSFNGQNLANELAPHQSTNWFIGGI